MCLSGRGDALPTISAYVDTLLSPGPCAKCADGSKGGCCGLWEGLP